MLEEIKLANLYRKVIDDEIITIDDLLSCGFSMSDIDNLISLKIIKKDNLNEGKYIFIGVSYLYKYKNLLLDNQEELLANRCLNQCINLLKKNNDNLINEFLNCIYNDDYDNALKIYDKMKKIKTKNFKATNYFYLYLLSFIIELPGKYRQTLESLNVESFILLYGHEDKTVYPRNKIVLAALNLDFDLALNELKTFLSAKKEISIQDVLEDVLLTEILKCEKKRKNIPIIDDDLSKIILFLITNQINLALDNIQEYLKYLGKEKYEYIIVNLIKACAIKNDSSNSEVILMLRKLSEPNFQLDKSFFIIEMERALEKCKIELAEVYQKILLESSKLGVEVDLSIYKKRFQRVREIIKKNERLNDSNRRDEEVAVKEKCKQVFLSKGIKILPPYDYLKCKRITKIIRDYPDVGYSKISDGDNIIIIIRYMPDNLGRVDIDDYLKKGKEAYDAQKYVSAIYFYKQLLQFGEPSASVYTKIGMSYLYLKRNTRALEYLTVADMINRKNNVTRYNLNEILLYLKTPAKEREELEKKPKVKMKEFEFVGGADNYGIDDLEEIILFIIDNSLDVESASEILFMSQEQLNLLRLIIAREYLLQGELEKAEEFLKSVESCKDKTDYVKKIYKEIQNNKSLYLKKKISNLSMKLSLTLKPTRCIERG